jgi:hypothetical protein
MTVSESQLNMNPVSTRLNHAKLGTMNTNILTQPPRCQLNTILVIKHADHKNQHLKVTGTSTHAEELAEPYQTSLKSPEFNEYFKELYIISLKVIYLDIYIYIFMIK